LVCLPERAVELLAHVQAARLIVAMPRRNVKHPSTKIFSSGLFLSALSPLWWRHPHGEEGRSAKKERR
jgi:hypothetical protein